MDSEKLVQRAVDLAMKAVANHAAYPCTREQMTRTVTMLIDGAEYSYWPARQSVGLEALTLIERSFLG